MAKLEHRLVFSMYRLVTRMVDIPSKHYRESRFIVRSEKSLQYMEILMHGTTRQALTHHYLSGAPEVTLGQLNSLYCAFNGQACVLRRTGSINSTLKPECRGLGQGRKYRNPNGVTNREGVVQIGRRGVGIFYTHAVSQQ